MWAAGEGLEDLALEDEVSMRQVRMKKQMNKFNYMNKHQKHKN